MDESQQADELLERHGAAVADAIVELEARLGVKSHFLRELQSDPSDWGFLVRLTVFVQAAIAHAVAHELERPELEGYLGKMNLNGRHGGLVSLAHQLEVVSKRDVRFIDALSEVRNRFAHRLENIDSNLSTFANSLSPTDFRKLVGGVVALPGDRDWLQNSPPVVRALFAGFLRRAAWMNAVELCSRLSLMASDERGRYARRILREARRGALTGLLGELRDSCAQAAKKPAG